jgi:methionine biosynthesis protein MetW
MASDATRYDEIVREHGLSSTHRQTIAWVPQGASVLELGCSSGFIGSILIEKKGCRVTGVEVDAAAAAEARERGLKVVEGSLEEPAFRESIGERHDIVIAADVLEHLSDPAPTLEHCKRWLKPDGRVILSVPNVATWSMRAQLFFRGDFEYQETGLLDRTHLRFFTWETLHDFVLGQGWQIEAVMVDSWELPFTQKLFFDLPLRLKAGRVVAIHQALAERVGQRFPNLCAKHIALLLRPPT